MDVKEQGNDVEEIMCEMMDVLENTQREIRMEMEKLKDEMKCREKDWTEERNKLKERIEKLEVRCEEYNKIKNNKMRQLEEREEMDGEREDVECVGIENIKEWIEKFGKNVKIMQEERKKNNIRDALMFTPSTSQLRVRYHSKYIPSTQLASISTESVRNNNDVDLIETPSISRRYAQNQNSNIPQLNESNAANSNTVLENRTNHTSSINFGDFTNLANRSTQSTSSDSHNANNTTNIDDNVDNNAKIICNCKKPAIQRIQKFGLNKGRPFYKCNDKICNFYKWANEDSAKSQGNARKKRSMVSSPDKNNDNFPRASTSNNNLENPSTNVMCNCNQSALKLTVAIYKDNPLDSPNRRRQFYRCSKSGNSACNFFEWSDEEDSRVPQNADKNSKKPKLIGDKRK